MRKVVWTRSWLPIWRPVFRKPLLIAWSGRRGLYTLRTAEYAAPAISLRGPDLMSAFYLNELVLSLTDRDDPHPELFAHYGAALAALSDGVRTEQALRQFELSLLAELGYGLIMDHDVETEQPLVADRRYRYVVDRGPIPAGSGGRNRESAELVESKQPVENLPSPNCLRIHSAPPALHQV